MDRNVKIIHENRLEFRNRINGYGVCNGKVR